jgi:hypothetical protein
MSRRVTKLFLATILLIATVFLPRSGQAAMTCCSVCIINRDTCAADCVGTNCKRGCLSGFMSCEHGCGGTCPG